MAVATDVSLPRAHTALFPDRCVVCGCDQPGSHVRLMTGTLGWWSWLVWWFGNQFVVKAPACSGCAWTLHARRLLSLVVTLAIVAVVMLVVWPHFKDFVPRLLQRWVAIGLALVCLLPQVLFEVFFAAPFDITAYEHSVDYEFTSKEYAIEFAMLNFHSAEWVKIGGESLNQAVENELLNPGDDADED